MNDRAATAPIPTGTVVFWFSDIEGSTSRWEHFPGAMAPALRRHDALVSTAIRERGGHIFKTMGDAFCAAFSTAGAAVAAAVAVQRGLDAEDFGDVGGLRVRIALHCGPADERDGDYFGGAVNRVARLLAIAHGGQTLVSAAVAALVADELPAGVGLGDLGSHRLKDLAARERVAQLEIADLPSHFPPLRSLEAIVHNLPIALTPLLGRERETREIAELLGAHRLVTIVGPGGVGKTRIALHAAADASASAPDGVWNVELASLEDGALVASSIARELGVRENPGSAPLETLVRAVAGKSLLLLIDNCEHLIADVARVVDALVRSAPGVRILATSREPLGLAGERVYRLGTLACPAPARVLAATDALGYGAVALFVERASAAEPSFKLTDANAPIVADICRRLDGIALAIELAAPRVRVLPVAQLDARLSERFRLLGGGRRGDLPRQQTLHALIAWSYELLVAKERTVFTRFGVFASSWTLEDAIAIAADRAIDEFDVVEIVTALVDKSLVTVESEGERNRYRLLESMRAFAEIQAVENRESVRLSARHAAWALAEAERLNAAWATMPSSAWERATSALVADARAAIDWALYRANDEALGMRIVGALTIFYARFAPLEGRRAIAAARERAYTTNAPLEIVARLDHADAAVCPAFVDWARQERSAASAAAGYAELGEPLREAMVERIRAQALRYLGRCDEALALLEKALVVFMAHGADRFTALTLDERAQVHVACGDDDLARADFEEALRLAGRTAYDRGLLFFESNFAELEYRLGNVERALALGRSAVGRRYSIGDAVALAIAANNLAMYEADGAAWAASRRAAEIAFGAVAEFESHWILALALQSLAAARMHEPGLEAAHMTNAAEAAALVLGFVDARLAAIEFTREYTEAIAYRRAIEHLDHVLGPDRRAELAREGASASLAATVARVSENRD